MLGKDFLLDFKDADLSGFKLALVIDNADPLCIERAKVRVIGVHDMLNEDPKNSIWAMHAATSKSGSGEVPDPGDWVYGFFLDKEDPMSFVWFAWARKVGITK